MTGCPHQTQIADILVMKQNGISRIEITIGSCLMKVILRYPGMKRSQGEGIKYRMDCSWRKTSPGVMPTKGSLLSGGTSRGCGIASFYCGYQANGFWSLWRIFSQETGRTTSSIVTSGLFWSIAKISEQECGAYAILWTFVHISLLSYILFVCVSMMLTRKTSLHRVCYTLHCIISKGITSINGWSLS